MNFASTLKRLREEKGVTQDTLAKYLGVTRSTIAGYETKGKQPNFECLIHMADYFNVTVDYLLRGTDVDKITLENYSSADRLLMVYYSKLTSGNREKLLDYANLLVRDERRGRVN